MTRQYESDLDKLRRKRDQAWELAGCARVDGDKINEKHWTDEVRRLAQLISEALLI